MGTDHEQLPLRSSIHWVGVGVRDTQRQPWAPLSPASCSLLGLRQMLLLCLHEHISAPQTQGESHPCLSSHTNTQVHGQDSLSWWFVHLFKADVWLPMAQRCEGCSAARNLQPPQAGPGTSPLGIPSRIGPLVSASGGNIASVPSPAAAMTSAPLLACAQLEMQSSDPWRGEVSPQNQTASGALGRCPALSLGRA